MSWLCNEFAGRRTSALNFANVNLLVSCSFVAIRTSYNPLPTGL